MTTLVVGATGATGRLLVKQLLGRDEAVKAIVRSPDRLPEKLRNHDRLTVIRAPACWTSATPRWRSTSAAATRWRRVWDTP